MVKTRDGMADGEKLQWNKMLEWKMVRLVMVKTCIERHAYDQNPG